MAGDFEKDFGYLMPFIDRIAEAAAELGDYDSRDELSRLIAGEKETWSRIRELLSGQTVGGTRADESEQTAEPAAQIVRQFTVGSLRTK